MLPTSRAPNYLRGIHNAMSRSLATIKADFDSAPDDAARQRAVIEMHQARDSTLRTFTRIIIAAAIMCGLAMVFILVGFIFMRLPMPIFPMVPMVVGVVTGFSCFVLSAIRALQRERYNAALAAFNKQGTGQAS